MQFISPPSFFWAGCLSGYSMQRRKEDRPKHTQSLPYRTTPRIRPQLGLSHRSSCQCTAGQQPILHKMSIISQYWTSRGYAVVNLNFAGSSRYGRAFRDALNCWLGVVDTADAISCVEHLSKQWLVMVREPG